MDGRGEDAVLHVDVDKRRALGCVQDEDEHRVSRGTSRALLEGRRIHERQADVIRENELVLSGAVPWTQVVYGVEELLPSQP